MVDVLQAHYPPRPPLDQPIVLEDASLKSSLSGGSIREHLRLWQEQHDLDSKLVAPVVPLSDNTSDASRNLYTQSGEDESYKVLSQDERDEEAEDVASTTIEPDTDDSTPTLLGTQKYLRRGDLVELVAGSEPLLAIFVRNIVGLQLQFYTIRGEWVNRRKTYVRFAVPGFVHPAELADIMPYLPEEEIGGNLLNTLQPLEANAPRDAGADLIRKISMFQQAADSVFRRNADRLNRVYELIAPLNKGDGPRQKGLREIAMIVLQKKDPAELTQAMLCAVHRALIPLQNIVWVHSYDLRNPVFEIHSERTMREITQVRDWVREYQEGITEDVTESFPADSDSTLARRLQNPISSFVQKARAAIAQSRLSRPLSASGAVGPSLVKVEPVPPASRAYREIPGQTFDDKEKAIIRYFDAWVASRYINLFTNLASMGPMILRATGMYNNLPFSREIGYTFLQELGIVTPWEDRSCYKLAGMRLPGHGLISEETTQLQRTAQEWAGKLLSDYPRNSAYKLKDSMATLRRDWDNLPVFCIDSAETLERDDGLSLQPVEGSSTEYWVHIHVANPSAFIAQDSPIGRYAAQLSQSVYLPEHKYSMLPPFLTDEHFSLANGRPCLTFSAKMSLEGDILESEISSGIVRSVYYLTPHMVAQALSLDVSEESDSISLLSVGGEFPANRRDHEQKTGDILEDRHVSMLRKLFELSQAAYQKRISRTGLDFSSWRPATVMRPQVFLGEMPGRPFQVNDKRIRRYEGDPIINLEVTSRGTSLVNEMVAELMITAGRVAATWCMDRNIPIPYRGIERDPEPRIQPEEFKKSLVDSSPEGGFVEYVRLLGQAGASASPLEHVALGLSAYCKATSPLRRYVDLYTHWQIEAALRYEAKTGTSLLGSKDNSYLPFSWGEVEERANTSVYREMRIRQLTAYSDNHWVTQALFRAFYFNQAPLPETFIVEVKFIAPGHQGFKVYMQWLMRNVFMEEKDVTGQEVDCQEGDLWETRIKSILPYFDRVMVEPIRLVKRKNGMA